MTADQLASELAAITCDLLASSGAEQLELLLARRAGLVDAISRCDPAAFSPEGSELLKTALQDGAASERMLAGFRLRTAEECSRLNAVRSRAPGAVATRSTVSIIA